MEEKIEIVPCGICGRPAPCKRASCAFREWAGGAWHSILVAIGLRPDWSKPEFAPPAFENCRPHPYRPAHNVPCCLTCGGGKKHAIHV